MIYSLVTATHLKVINLMTSFTIWNTLLSFWDISNCPIIYNLSNFGNIWVITFRATTYTKGLGHIQSTWGVIHPSSVCINCTQVEQNMIMCHMSEAITSICRPFAFTLTIPEVTIAWFSVQSWTMVKHIRDVDATSVFALTYWIICFQSPWFWNNSSADPAHVWHTSGDIRCSFCPCSFFPLQENEEFIVWTFTLPIVGLPVWCVVMIGLPQIMAVTHIE